MTRRRLSDPSPPNVNPSPATAATVVHLRPLPAVVAGKPRRPHLFGEILPRRGAAQVLVFEEGSRDG